MQSDNFFALNNVNGPKFSQEGKTTLITTWSLAVFGDYASGSVGIVTTID